MAGRVQLETTGPQDKFFTIDPHYSYFREHFVKHSNYSKSFIKMDVGVTDFGSLVRYRISPDQGDLIKTISLDVELNPISNAMATGMGWVESIGHAMIEYVDIIIGGTTIQRIPSDYLQIYSEQNYTQTNQTGLKQLIGKFPNRTSSLRANNPTILSHLGVASSSQKYFIDIPFYFYRNPELAIPLCAIDRQEVEIEIKLRSAEECIVNNQKVTVDGVSSWASNAGKGYGYGVGTYLQNGNDIDGEATGDGSGFVVAITPDGKYAVVGAPDNDPDNARTNAGHVRVFSMAGATSQRGPDIDGSAANDFFGQAAAISADGNRVVVGAPNHDYTPSITNTGRVRVYDYNSGTNAWDLNTTLDPPTSDTVANTNFGSVVSISHDGTVIGIGARGLNNSQGKYYAYRVARDNTNTVGIQPEGSEVGNALGDALGYSVTVSGDGKIIVAGANNPDGTSYVKAIKNTSGSTWVTTDAGSNYIAASENSGDEFGFSSSLSYDGHVLAVGGPKNDGTQTDAGHVRVFIWDGADNWYQMGTDIDGESGFDQSGISVSISGDGKRLAIGANMNPLGDARGHVRVYEWNGSTDWSSAQASASSGQWLQRGIDLDAEATADEFGWSVSLTKDGNRLIVGAKSNDGTGTSAGHARIFDFFDRTFTQNLIKKFSITAEMVFLDPGERIRIQNANRDMVITQIQRKTFDIPYRGSQTNEFDLGLINPVKELFFVFQRENPKTVDNFVPPFDYDNIYLSVNDRLLYYENLDKLELILDDEHTIQGKAGSYMFLKAVQSSIHHSKTPLIRRFYSYSFSLEPEKPYPTGQRNFSLIRNQRLVVTTNACNSDRKLHVYALSYNILRIVDGIAQTIFEDAY